MGDPATAIIANGSCAVWSLPGGGTGAGFARSVVRAVFAGLGIPGELAFDVAVGASELVTNAYVHASGVAVPAELWMYLRWMPAPEVVLKVYDAAPWRRPITSGPLRPALNAECGRGFEIVDALTAQYGGGWGMHRTRSRLGAESMAGKAVFLAVPIPNECRARALRPVLKPTRELAGEICLRLAARGLGRPQWSAGYGMAVICVRAGVHVWVREQSISYCLPGGHTVRHPRCNGVEVVEQVVRHCVDLDTGRG